MSGASLQLGAPSLRTRVAKRLFGLFLACALLPVAGFGIYGNRVVRNQLEAQAQAALRRDAKSIGMSIVERLMMADVGVRSLVLGQTPPGTSVPGVQRYAVLELASQELDEAERARLADGESVLRTRDADEGAVLELVRAVPGRPGRVLVAELDSRFVFVPERVPSQERYWVHDRAGRLLIMVPDEPASLQMLASRSETEPRRAFEAHSQEGRELGTVWPLFLSGAFGQGEWRIGVSRSESLILGPLHEFERSFPVIALLTIGLAIAASLRQIRRTLVPLDALSTFAGEMTAGNLDARASVQSGDEFEDLGTAFDAMAAQIRQHVAALKRLNAIGQALSREADVDAFLALALEGAAELTRADGCALVLGDEGAFETSRVWLDGRPVTRPVAATLFSAVGAEAATASRTATFRREADGGEVDWRALEDETHVPVQSLLALPLQVEKGPALGALVLLSRRPAEYAFPREVVDLGESLASQAAAALRQARNVETLRALFEGLIHLTVRAIDEKSAYTGEHCRKVPILTELIAEAACAAGAGPLKDFILTDGEKYELRIAALLHDCGKVVTPVHVMDKATKLETLFDRIELVRTRFELVRRDLELAHLRERLRHGGDREPDAEREAALADEIRRLDEDLAFVEWANRGRESMSRLDQARVAEVARQHRWTDAEGEERTLLTEDEVRNLSISRGTLNAEERKVMEDHVVSTINLLEELPFPKELANVPYIAGAHHEHCDGSGYPQGLGGEQLTMQARILGLADVFEALTAETRPYKPGMTLTETLVILRDMRDAGHIDPRLHDLFVEQKVYLRYAVEHLDPQQIDAAHWPDLEEMTGGWGSPAE